MRRESLALLPRRGQRLRRGDAGRRDDVGSHESRCAGVADDKNIVRGVNNDAAYLLVGMEGIDVSNEGGEDQAAAEIEEAVKETIKEMKSMLVEKMGYSTPEVGDMIVQKMS